MNSGKKILKEQKNNDKINNTNNNKDNKNRENREKNNYDKEIEVSYKILNKINNPTDVKRLKHKELDELTKDVRKALFNRLSKYGGHIASNFGTVELEIAMHYVFNSPIDKFVFDVSHQTYTHKMLTGRREAFTNDEHFKDCTGFTNPEESEHDLFNIGHTSTSISLATGLAKERDIKGTHENIVAVIGDGALSGGEAMEALNFAASELNSNLIIIVNDNNMAIAEVHGGIYKSLKELRETNGKSKNNFFKAIGLDYIYEEEGNNVHKLIKVLEKVKDIDHPVIVHIHTIKGKGYKLAEEHEEALHNLHTGFDIKTGKPEIQKQGENYKKITAKFLLDKVKKDKNVTVITPGMPSSVGLTPDIRKEMGKQYVDVGIAEEQAIAMASGIVKNGGKPVVVSNATFFQRAYDQISQDAAINNNPIAIIMNFGSCYGQTDITHIGIFTNSIFANIPNVRVLAPTSKKEYLKMINYAIEQRNHPTIVLVPGNGVCDDNRKPDEDYSNVKFKVEQKGEKVAIIALGDFYQKGEDLSKAIENNMNFKPTLINPRFSSDLDEKILKELLKNHNVIITLEDGILSGGFGEKVAGFYGEYDIKVLNYGLRKEFYDRYDPETLISSSGITSENIIKKLKSITK